MKEQIQVQPPPSRFVARARGMLPIMADAVARARLATLGPEADARDTERRLRCLTCGVRAGTPCRSLGEPFRTRVHEARAARRRDLALLLGCEWCRLPWSAPWPGGQGAGSVVATATRRCAFDHVHVGCVTCAPGAGIAAATVPCPRSVVARALAALQRVGVARP